MFNYLIYKILYKKKGLLIESNQKTLFWFVQKERPL
jgi:hypothetical protein